MSKISFWLSFINKRSYNNKGHDSKIKQLYVSLRKRSLCKRKIACKLPCKNFQTLLILTLYVCITGVISQYMNRNRSTCIFCFRRNCIPPRLSRCDILEVINARFSTLTPQKCDRKIALRNLGPSLWVYREWNWKLAVTPVRRGMAVLKFYSCLLFLHCRKHFHMATILHD